MRVCFQQPTTDARPADPCERWERISAEVPLVKAREVPADPSYVVNAGCISERLGRYGGAARAADLIEGLAQDRRTPT